MIEECKSAEVTFKYYIPDHEEEIIMHMKAVKAFALLNTLDQMCRSIMKYDNIEETSAKYKLAEEIRQTIRENIDLE